MLLRHAKALCSAGKRTQKKRVMTLDYHTHGVNSHLTSLLALLEMIPIGKWSVSLWHFHGCFQVRLTESPILQQFPMPPGSRVICLQKAIAQKSPADFFQSSQRSSKPPPSPTTPPELPDEKVLEPGWIPNPLGYSIDIDIYMIYNYILYIIIRWYIL